MIGHGKRAFERQVVERVRLHGWTFFRDAVLITVAYVLADEMRFDGHIAPIDRRGLLAFLPLIVIVYAIFSYLFGIHRRIWQYAGIRDVRSITDASLFSIVVIGVIDFIVPGHRPLPLTTVPVGGVFALSGLVIIRLWPRMVRTRVITKDDSTRVLIVGAGHAGSLVASDLLDHPQWRRHPVGFLDDDPRKRRMHVHGIPILGTTAALDQVVIEYDIDLVGVAIPSATSQQLDRILGAAQGTSARIQILPSRAEIISGTATPRLRDINLDDLLGRVPNTAEWEDSLFERTLRDRVVLVTGARGSIGAELCRQLLRLRPARVLALDNNETGLFYLQRELQDDPNRALLTMILADITDEGKLGNIFRRYQPDVVFHAAAYKHVPMLEAHPEEAVYVNVAGTLNLCRQAVANECERFVFISTDKAVNPVNALGYSKRIGELIVRAHAQTSTVFCSVRFGNVVGSRGSALPEFIRQIDSGGPITVTHPDVERYFMTIPESVSLVIQAGAFAEGGELFMLDMGKPIKISTLVKRIIRLRGLRVGKDIEIIYTGLRPGEKLTEELIFEAEQAEPTPNPAIFALEDAFAPELAQLEKSVQGLLHIAGQGDPEKIHEQLAAVAAADDYESVFRLGSVS